VSAAVRWRNCGKICFTLAHPEQSCLQSALRALSRFPSKVSLPRISPLLGVFFSFFRSSRTKNVLETDTTRPHWLYIACAPKAIEVRYNVNMVNARDVSDSARSSGWGRRRVKSRVVPPAQQSYRSFVVSISVSSTFITTGVRLRVRARNLILASTLPNRRRIFVDVFNARNSRVRALFGTSRLICARVVDDESRGRRTFARRLVS